MQTFKDANGDEWSISLDTSVLRSVKKELSLDLLSLSESAFQTLATDDVVLVDLVSFLCTDQIRNKKLDETGFAKLLIGDVLDDAMDAVVDELVFISRRNQKLILAKVRDKVQQASKTMTDKAVELLDSPKMDQMINREMQAMEQALGEL